jgi:hypothetical protein
VKRVEGESLEEIRSSKERKKEYIAWWTLMSVNGSFRGKNDE